MTHLTADLFAFFDDWLPPPPARVLDVGCGSGALTQHLLAAGYSALGIDPEAPDGDAFERTTLEGFEPGGPFDAAVASRSLHHVHDLGAAVGRLRRALRPGARLVVFEFAVERLDDDARAWLVRHGLESHAAHEPPPVTPVVDVMAALDERFRLIDESWGGYLAREYDREDLHHVEEAAIAAGELRAIGARLVYEAAERVG